MERDDHAHLIDALAAIDPATLGSWAALTSEQFERMFGRDSLASLDAIRYDE